MLKVCLTIESHFLNCYGNYLRDKLKFGGDKIHQGGGVAAPIASQVLGEVLPYLEIKKDNESEEDIISKVLVPNLEGYTVSEAEKVLKELNLNMECSEVLQNVENGVISEQIPISGVEIFEGSSVIVK